MKLQHHLKGIADHSTVFDIKYFIRKLGDKYFFSDPTHLGDYYFEIMSASRNPMVCYTVNSTHGFSYSSIGDNIYDAFIELAAEIDNTLLNSNTISTNAASNGTLTGATSFVPFKREYDATPVGSSSDNSMYCSCKSPLLITNHAMGKEFEYCKTCKKEYVKKSNLTYPEDNGFKWY